MAIFDKKVWTEKAVRKHQRLTKRLGKALADEYLTRDIQAIRGLQYVLEWCDGNNIEVEFKSFRGNLGELCFADKLMTVDNSANEPEKELFIILHELGHFLLLTQGHPKYASGYASGLPSDSALYRVTVVAEESEAWWRGEQLANRLGIELNQERLTSARLKALKSYFRWALRR